MSRWTIPALGTMTEQQIFNECAYHMLAHGGAPRDLLLKPESQEYNRGRAWGYFVRQRRAPKHAAQLIADMEQIHRVIPPAQWSGALVALARVNKLEIAL